MFSVACHVGGIHTTKTNHRTTQSASRTLGKESSHLFWSNEDVYAFALQQGHRSVPSAIQTMMMSMTSRFVGTASRMRTAAFVAPSIISSFRFFSTEEGLYDKVAIIGAGKMAQALMSPLIKAGIQPASKISVFDVSTSTLSKVKKQFEGIQTAKTLGELVKDADIIICCVKPQNLTQSFFEQVSTNKDATLLSVVAGKPIQTYLNGGFSKVARSMPNTPATIGKGMTVWSCTENISTDEREKIKAILNSCGKSVRKHKLWW